MNIQSNKKVVTVIALFFFAVGLFIAPMAKALTLSPVRYEVTTDQGTDVGSDMVLINDQPKAMTYYSSFSNFEAEGDSGTPKFTDSESGIATWMTTTSSVTLAVGESRKVPFTIHVPPGTEAGGYFGTIFWSTNPPAGSGGGQVSIGAKIGMLVFLTVSGDAKESAGLASFNTLGHQWLYRALPVSFEYRFKNDGRDRVKPAGNVVIRSILGWKIASVPANAADGNVLPSSTRKFNPVWTRSDTQTVRDPKAGYSFTRELSREWHNFALGIYRAKVAVVYGSQGTSVASNSVYFIVLPVELLLVIILILLLGFFIIRTLLRRQHRMIERKIEARMHANS